MGWSLGFDTTWKRDIGYGVPAVCDQPGCEEKIDRGLSYVCGSGPYGGEHGCGLYFCGDHLSSAGEKRDCAQLCRRCLGGRWGAYKAKPDHMEWVAHKLSDESWAEWRGENAREVEAMRSAIAASGLDPERSVK